MRRRWEAMLENGEQQGRGAGAIPYLSTVRMGIQRRTIDESSHIPGVLRVYLVSGPWTVSWLFLSSIVAATALLPLTLASYRAIVVIACSIMWTDWWVWSNSSRAQSRPEQTNWRCAIVAREMLGSVFQVRFTYSTCTTKPARGVSCGPRGADPKEDNEEGEEDGVRIQEMRRCTLRRTRLALLEVLELGEAC